MKIVFLIILFLIKTIFGNTIIVNKNGPGYTSIQQAINAAGIGDTIKILPGNYEESIVLNKDIKMLGSGYENTKIYSSNEPTIIMTDGTIMWLSVSSSGGTGIYLNGGSVRNTVINGCSGNGIYSSAGSASVINCVIINNSLYGIKKDGSSIQGAQLSVTNTICYNNGDYDFYQRSGKLSVSYSNGNEYFVNFGPGCINQNPQFNSASDFHLLPTSSCINKGNPGINDPDGTISDMGYFGGSNCPTYPVVTHIKLVPQPDGTIMIEAHARANY